MLVEELIKQLQQIPAGTEVCLFDWRKSLSDDIGDGSSEGVYSDFKVEMVTMEDDENEFFKEQHDREFIPWCGLYFDNDDYNEEGQKEE